MAAIIRLKRKACEEPAEGLVIALKKPKCELSDVNEVIFKFAATLNSEKESIRDHIEAALSKEKTVKFPKWRNPKNVAISQCKIKNLREKLQAEHKSANEKKKIDFLNNRRLILSEEFQELEDSAKKDAEVRRLFHLYDIIEENEDVKKQNEDVENMITCNNVPLIREKVDDYVIDIYYAAGRIDQTFVDETVNVRPVTLNEDDIYFGGSDSEECYEDEDDSNDENNWRNDYPEESNSEKGSDSENGSCSDEYDAAAYQEEVSEAFHNFDINDDDDGEYHSRILKELKDDYDGDSDEIESD